MVEMILPGTYIEVRPEGLIAPGQVTVGNVGIVGTAAKGPLNTPVLLSSFADAQAAFGPYDSFMDPANPTKPRPNSLTLVRALELAYAQGATTVWAVRVAATATPASVALGNVTLDAVNEGTWANGVRVDVVPADPGDVLMIEGSRPLTDSEITSNQIDLTPAAVDSPRNRISVTAPDRSPVKVTFSNGHYTVQAAPAGSVLTYAYVADPTAVIKVTITLDRTVETYLVTDINGLIAAVNDVNTPSALVKAVPPAGGATPAPLTTGQHLVLQGGTNGEGAGRPAYVAGLENLLDVDAHLIVAAGQTNTDLGSDLDAHCQKASTDAFQRDRIGITGPALATGDYVGTLIGSTVSSDRIIFVAPGFLASSAAPEEPKPTVVLPGAYTAAVIAGMLASVPAHISLTNKPVAVADLEVRFNNAQLTELVQNRVTAIEVNRGIRVLRGQTTDTGAFREITTRRIVDFAKFGVRSAAAPYIGLLNNDRVRSALRATINSFLKQMLDDEMLVNYSLDVSATREQQIAGIVAVTMTLQPVFSINFIKVTMILS